VWARKDFFLETASAHAAELCIFADSRVLVTLNGRELPAYDRVHIRARPYSGTYPADKFPEGHAMHGLNGKPYREFWQGGWERVPVDPGQLRKGLNSAVMRPKLGEKLRMLIEPSLFPDRSAVSRDGGATWDRDGLSRAGNLNGEYIVRLALQRHPAGGWAESEPVDLWPHRAGAVALPAEVTAVRLKPVVDLPEGTAVRLLARVGPTPAYDPKDWTPWREAADLAGAKAPPAGARFLQWRAELSASPDRLAAPRLTGMQVEAQVRPQAAPLAGRIESCRVEQPAIVRPSHPFVHAGNSERLKLLRSQAGLDEVVKGRPAGLEQVLELARFTKKTFGGNAPGSLKADSSWDALELWNQARLENRLLGAMCTHRAAFFTQCATALGYPARVCVWSHAIAEVWLDDPGGWVAFDPSGGFYFEVAGRPASMLEVSLAWDGGTGAEPKAEVRKVWSAKNKSKPEPNRGLAWYTRFWVPMRSNYLESAEPSEKGHGTTAFKYDGDLHWLHPMKEPLPWFSFCSDRPGDFLFTMNAVNLHLAAGDGAGTVLQVQAAASGPNVARLEARLGEGDWKEVQPTFPWKLSAGRNVLEVRAVNAFGLAGRTARAEVKLGE
jgi:hypothetical protein